MSETVKSESDNEQNIAAKPLKHQISPLRIFLRVVIIALLIWMGFWLHKKLPPDPKQAFKDHRQNLMAWSAARPVVSALLVVGAFWLCTDLLLPVWPVQLVAGLWFGFAKGILLCVIGGAAGAVTSVWLSHWLVGKWFLQRYAPRVKRINDINESMGNVGVFVVMGIRLCHILPFGVSNYLFGLTHISAWSVFAGTIAGCIPAIGAWVIVGADLYDNWRYWAFLGVLNGILVIPLAARYYQHRKTRVFGDE